MSGQQKFYITTAISYPNGPPHIGHAYEAHRHRRDRALRAARRQGRVLPHRHRRARPQDEADGRQGGPQPAGAGRPQLGSAFARWTRRSTSPTTISSAPRRSGTTARRRRSGGAWRERKRRHLPEEIRRLVLRARRGLLRREARRRVGPDGVRVRAAGHAGRVVRGGDLSSSASRPIRTGCSRTTRSTPISSCRASAGTRW